MPQPKNEERRQLLQIGLGVAVAAGLGAAGLGVARVAGAGGGTAERLVAGKLKSLPLDDPGHSAWLRIDPFRLTLTPQQLTTPFLKAATIASLAVRAAHDGAKIAFHLEWQDAGKEDTDVMDRFRDAAALMFPVNAGKLPPVTMGDAANPVYLLHWKASWQRAAAGEPDSLQANFPNVHRDILPETILKAETARTYYPAVVAGNPMAAAGAPAAVAPAGAGGQPAGAGAPARLASPVEEAVAKGFGTVQSLPTREAFGKGVRSEKGWQLVIALPMAGGAGRPAFEPGKEQQAAFAVWSGSDGNVGGRKHYTSWMPVLVKSSFTDPQERM